MLGGRKGSTPLSYNLQPAAQYVFDPITRRAVRYVETVVPTINQAETPEGMFYAADRFYFNIGAINSATDAPPAVNSISGTLQQWDATQKMQYARFRSGGAAPSSLIYFVYPTGVYGDGSSFTPKNVSVTKCVMEFTAKFGDNSDYGSTAGVGFLNGSSGGAVFSTTSDHFIQVLRNVASWELGTCDGTTISQSSGGTADSSWHEFRVEWEDDELRLYVDDTLTITKTTNLPAKPLRINIIGQTTLGIDVADLLIRWE